MVYRRTNLDNRISAERVCAAVLCVALVCSCAHGFTLLDFPSDTAVQAGGYKVWQLDHFDPPHVTQSYAIESSLDAGLVSGASAAALNAITNWDNASAVMDLSVADYGPVESGNGMGGASQWEGPAGLGVGANIDILARPRDFTLTDFRGKVYGFGEISMAFTVISAISGNIQSVDIYLNTQIDLINPNYHWATDGGDMDVETVILHELGHAMGLDHPDLVSGSAANYDPYTFHVGYQNTGGEVMHSTYYPNGVNRTLKYDDIRGLQFLYPPLEGDANSDGLVSADDYTSVQLNFGNIGVTGIQGDANADGLVSADDFDSVQINFGNMSEPPIPDDDGGTPVPEPATLALLGAAGVMMLTQRRRSVQRQQQKQQ